MITSLSLFIIGLVLIAAGTCLIVDGVWLGPRRDARIGLALPPGVVGTVTAAPGIAAATYPPEVWEQWPVGSAVRHAVDNPGHEVAESIREPWRCLTCGTESRVWSFIP